MREVLLTAHDETGVPRMERRLKLDSMGPRQGGSVCDSAGQRSVGLQLVSSVQILFPRLTNSQCIVVTVALFLVAPIIIVAAVLFTALAGHARAQLKSMNDQKMLAKNNQKPRVEVLRNNQQTKNK